MTDAVYKAMPKEKPFREELFQMHKHQLKDLTSNVTQKFRTCSRMNWIKALTSKPLRTIPWDHPPFKLTILNKPRKLTFAEKSVHHIQPAKFVYMNLS